MRRAVSFIASAVEFETYWIHLKSVPCPHCRAVGHLNRHGTLKGYEEQGSETVVRGWRIFCSNRNRRKGCGHTHSILLAQCLRRRTVRAARFWKFLDRVLGGSSLLSAWETVRGVFTMECGYRLWKAWKSFQPGIRSLLCRMGEPPPSSLKDPFLHGIEHLKFLFSEAECPVIAFQLHFQKSFPG